MIEKGAHDQTAHTPRATTIRPSHCGGPEDGQFVVDVWESPEAFAVFAQSEIGPASQNVRPGRARIHPIHNTIKSKGASGRSATGSGGTERSPGAVETLTPTRRRPRAYLRVPLSERTSSL